MIRQATAADAESIAAIYNHYILNTVVTFEEDAVTPSDMEARIHQVNVFNLPWIVAEEKGHVIGYAYATKWHDRLAYRFTVEVTVYLSPKFEARGWGTKLFEGLFAQLRTRTIHAAIGVIALPNPASIALHEKFGMKKVGHFHEVGYKFDQWVDVGCWQKRFPT